MAIIIVTGNPGAGKTYFAVRHLVKEYFDYDKEAKRYIKKPNKKDVTIVSNIDKLKLEHINFDSLLESLGLTYDQFFTKKHQDIFHADHPHVVYFIDEAQVYFRTKFYKPETFEYFEYHRHYGDDVYLITLDRYKITKEIGTLCAKEIRAVTKSLSLTGEMTYKTLISGDQVAIKSIRPDKTIFNLYKSRTHAETEKHKNPMVKYLAIFVLFLIGSIFLFKEVGFSSSKDIKDDSIPNGKEVRYKVEDSLTKNDTKKSRKKFDWVRINGVVTLNGQLYSLLDPIDGVMKKKMFYPHKVKCEFNDCYAYVEIIDNEISKDNKKDDYKGMSRIIPIN